MSSFYEFKQNNSGGSFDINEDVSITIVIETMSFQDAVDKFFILTENQSASCPCCSKRWQIDEEDEHIIILKENQTLQEYLHEQLSFSLYNHYPHKAIIHYLDGSKEKIIGELK